jgi:hypothetical protein
MTALELIYPPVSSQEAVWLEGDTEVEALLRQSDFYMIVARAEAAFCRFSVEPDNVLTFDLQVGNDFIDQVRLALWDLDTVIDAGPDTIEVEAGPKLIRIWDRDPNDQAAELLDWFTTEKLLFDRSRNKSGVNGLDRYRIAFAYDLLYVGIAKVGDAWDRLIRRAHKARTDILSNETQRFPGARVSDEVFLLFFRLDSMFIKTLGVGDGSGIGKRLADSVEPKTVTADAEKAFVSLLEPAYNKVVFASYPRGRDGLFGSGLDRYGYAIRENLVLKATAGQVVGDRETRSGLTGDGAYVILVDGDSVEVLRPESF